MDRDDLRDRLADINGPDIDPTSVRMAGAVGAVLATVVAMTYVASAITGTPHPNARPAASS